MLFFTVLAIAADVQFVGASAAQHRKAVLMIRQSLNSDSAYADAVSHGNGLASLQFRGASGEQTYQMLTQADEPARIRIVRRLLACGNYARDRGVLRRQARNERAGEAVIYLTLGISKGVSVGFSFGSTGCSFALWLSLTLIRTWPDGVNSPVT